MFNADKVLMEKWAPVLEHSGTAPIADAEKKAITARLLENTELALIEQGAHQNFQLNETNDAGTQTDAVANPEPVLISLVRRAMPNLIAYDICGVQPMTGPTGLIFAMKSRYNDARNVAVDSRTSVLTTDTEALFNEADTDFSGAGTHAVGDGEAGTDTVLGSAATNSTAYVVVDVQPGGSIATLHSGSETGFVGFTFTSNAAGSAGSSAATTAEGLVTLQVTSGVATSGTGDTTLNIESEDLIADMGFTIEKATVTAKSRALRAEYTMEMAQDLKAVHGLDAESELANILSQEILAEINREVVKTVNDLARVGISGAIKGKIDLTTGSSIDVGGGRWGGERYQGLIFALEKEANQIAIDTRRGKGNYVICSSNVASALAASGMLNYLDGTAANGLNVDPSQNTFAGTLKSGLKVYVDPYASADYATVGYKGSNTYDAGLFYCPYVPLTMVKAVGENTFQPKIGFKTRYGIQQNPFVGTAAGAGTRRANQYFRINAIANI